MVLGISSFTYGWSVGIPGQLPARRMNAVDLINQTSRFGLSCLQLGDNLPIHELSTRGLEEIKMLVGRDHLRLEVGARKLTAEHLDRYIFFAKYFNSPLLRFVIDGPDYEPDIPTVAAIIRNALPDLERYNITLGIENHDRFKAQELAGMMKMIDHPRVGICLDCVNSLGAGEGLDWVSSVLLPYTVNLHIKDFNIKRHSHMMGFTVTGTPAGKGMLNIPDLIVQLQKFNRCESAVLEQWVAPESDVDATVEKELAWADAGIHYLKSLNLFT